MVATSKIVPYWPNQLETHNFTIKRSIIYVPTHKLYSNENKVINELRFSFYKLEINFYGKFRA